MNNRRIVRFVWFGITIVLGLVLGLLAGWSRDVKTKDTRFSDLRQDYQIDLVLMVAEIYHKDHNLAAARDRLGYLQAEEIVAYVEQARIDAKTIGYAEYDLKLMGNLADALQVNAGEGG